MISPISTTASAQAAAPVPPSKGSSTKASGQKSEARKDSVHLSSAAQSQLSAAQSALQEASETPAQTPKRRWEATCRRSGWRRVKRSRRRR